MHCPLRSVASMSRSRAFISGIVRRRLARTEAWQQEMVSVPPILLAPPATPSVETAAEELADDASRSDSMVDIAAPTSRYERSGLTERQAAKLEKRLLETMERDRPFRDAELTLKVSVLGSIPDYSQKRVEG